MSEEHGKNGPEKGRGRRMLWYNLAFVLVCGGLLAFLAMAPEETTALVPRDNDHQRFFGMKKKEAEKFCEDCHNPEGQVPLPEGHPPKYRCLFCHKRK